MQLSTEFPAKIDFTSSNLNYRAPHPSAHVGPMERPTSTIGALGGINDPVPCALSRDAHGTSIASTPATFFAPFVARGWRFVGDATRTTTYGSLTMVTPGNDNLIEGKSAPFMSSDVSFASEAMTVEARRTLRACGLLVSKDFAPAEQPRLGKATPPRTSLRDHIAEHLKCMMSAMVALRVCATVYRHKRWAFECFREMYRKSRELKRRLRNSKKSALGNDACESLKKLLHAFDVMMERLCDPSGRIRGEFYDGMVTCPWDVDYEWQKNAAFHEEMFAVPYADKDDRDMTHSCEVRNESWEAHEPASQHVDPVATGAKPVLASRRLSVGSTASADTDDDGVMDGKRKYSELSSDREVAAKCRMKPKLREISCSVALAMAAEIDIVAAAAAHFFVTCNLCKDGPSFHEYLTNVTSAYGLPLAKKMKSALQTLVVPHIGEERFPDDVSFHYTMLVERYATASSAQKLLPLVAADPNPSLHIVMMQHVEGAYIMSRDGPDDEIDARFNRLMRDYSLRVAASHHQRMGFQGHSGVGTRSPLPSLIRKWMDTCYDSVARLYSPAVPSYQAMYALYEASPEGWIEISSGGTGYWTSVLTTCKIPAQAVNVTRQRDDKTTFTPMPPTSEPFVAIHDDVPDVCAEFKNFGLLINCLPRDGDLAIECVSNFTGTNIALIGEWQGSTAGSRFLRRLAKGFEFIQAYPLGAVGDRLFELSIWRRRAKRLSKKFRKEKNLSTNHTFPSVKRCHVAGCCSTSHTLFCCALCRAVFVCPNHLCSLHDEWDLEHAKVHEDRLLPTIDRMRSYDVELEKTNEYKLMRSETIMAFNPYRYGAETWTVDYRARLNDTYEIARLGVPRIDPVPDWR